VVSRISEPSTVWLEVAGRSWPWTKGEKVTTWRIIPYNKWLVTPMYKPFRPFVKGITLLRGLTNHGY